MPPAPTAADLLRSIGLNVDGPARWGSLPTSRSAGIFAVETASPLDRAPLDLTELRRWLERVPGLLLDGERPTQTTLAQRLAAFWVPGHTLLYVGRTSKALNSRVAAAYATELGHRRPHPGGHWLKALTEPSRLRLWWAETEAPEEYEDALLGAFAAAVPDTIRSALPPGEPLPWANLESPSGAVRDTGLTGSLLSVEETPVRSTNVKRSDPSGTVSRRSPTTRTTSRSATRSSSPSSSASATGGRSATAGVDRSAPTHVTTEGLASMQAELARLQTEERPQVVERIKLARELGDLRENADYEAARNEQSFLEGRIQALERQLRTAVIISTETRTSIGMGSRVRYEVDGQPGELSVVGTTESNPAAGRISAASPVGRALLGHRAGDEVVVTTPAAEIHYRILEVG